MDRLKRNGSLDGLRMWAITLIILSHCGLLAQGGFGNAMFFAISGFFMSSPFVLDDPEKRVISLKDKKLFKTR